MKSKINVLAIEVAFMAVLIVLAASAKAKETGYTPLATHRLPTLTA